MQTNKKELSIVKLFTILLLLIFTIGLHSEALSRPLCGQIGTIACIEADRAICRDGSYASKRNNFCLNAAQTSTPYTTITMVPNGRDWDIRHDVHMLTPEELAPKRIAASGGAIYPINSQRPFGPADFFETLYVMDALGNIYVHQIKINGEEPLFKHSSFFSGGNVAAAGTLVWSDDGIEVTNDSGHYLPRRADIEKAVKQLKLMGIKAIVSPVH